VIAEKGHSRDPKKQGRYAIHDGRDKEMTIADLGRFTALDAVHAGHRPQRGRRDGVSFEDGFGPGCYQLASG